MMESFVMTYSFIPSLIAVLLLVFVVLAWAFGTDTYDMIEKHMDDEDSVMFALIHSIVSVLSTILWFTLNSVTPVRVICAFWNAWLAIVLIILFLFMIVAMLEILRNYCLTKRGKKL